MGPQTKTNKMRNARQRAKPPFSLSLSHSMLSAGCSFSLLSVHMESLAFMDDLLDFSSDIGEEVSNGESKSRALPSRHNPRRQPREFGIVDPDTAPRFIPVGEEEEEEEELEWLSHKDAFPPLETFIEVVSDHSKHHSPVSVLENSSSPSTPAILLSCLKVPVRARSKGRRRRHVLRDQLWFSRPLSRNLDKREPTMPITLIGRQCQHCRAEKTPQWRAGPLGPKTLCNACGVRFKSGRLVPEYRPSSSPTFSIKLHSNSHRKIMEMRSKKLLGRLAKPVDEG